MNKVIVTNKEGFISGNTVLEPDYNPSRKVNDEKYKKLEKSRKEAQEKVKQQKLKGRLAVLRSIALVFVLALLVVGRFAQIYSLQSSLTKTRSQISNLQAENENLKIVLLKDSNLKTVEDTAVNKLHMVRPDTSKVMKVDLNKVNYFAAQSNENNEHLSLLDRLKKILF